MTALPPLKPSKALLAMPVCVRVHLVRFSLWRQRREPYQLKTSTLALCLALLSGSAGFLLAQLPGISLFNEAPVLDAARPAGVYDDNSANQFPNPQQWGQLQAEVLRLRVLFSRITEIADVRGSEFALAVQLADERFLDSTAYLNDTSEFSAERFTLAKRSVGHMTSQGELMLSMTERRRQARNFSLSGSPVVRAHLTSLYGYRVDPRSGRKRFHGGLDFAGPRGSKVLALADGVVTYSGRNGSYGNLVELEHSDGYRTRYAHNDTNLVKVGGVVSKGQAIATMGSTGKSTGTHVHVEVRHKGRPIDPLRFIGAGS